MTTQLLQIWCPKKNVAIRYKHNESDRRNENFNDYPDFLDMMLEKMWPLKNHHNENERRNENHNVYTTSLSSSNFAFLASVSPVFLDFRFF